MKAFKIALCAATASLMMTSAAVAQDAPEVSFNIAATSDYVFRGVSQSDEDPAISGGVDVTKGLVYGGLWASTVDFGDDTSAEYDIYAGFTPTLGEVSLDLGAIYYGYVDAPSGSEYDYWEFKAAAEVPVGPAALGVAFYYSPEFFGETGSALYSELSGSYSPTDAVSIGGGLGYQEIDDADNYTTWNLGVSYAFTENFAGDLRYHGTDINSCNICDDRVVATISATFP